MENEISKSVFKTCSRALIWISLLITFYVLSMGPVCGIIYHGGFANDVSYFPYYFYFPVWIIIDCNSPVGWPEGFMTPREIVNWYRALFISK